FVTSNDREIYGVHTMIFPFFFQAEDGIRYRNVTGVQTCALPISGETERRGFIDNLVGLSVIEYERDLRMPENFKEGYNQIKQYCASRINDGHPSELVIGILSDTVRWYAYEVSDISVGSKDRMLGSEDITL